MPKTIFITGCSTGIGRALALDFSERGFNVLATARNIDSLKGLVQKGITTLSLDINSSESLCESYNIIKKSIPQIDILINNAGYAAMGPLVEMPLETMELQFKTNVTSQLEVIKTFLPLLKKNSKVINISSVSGDLTTPFAGAYCATKAALSSLSAALRMELAPFGIQVIEVRPGAIESNFGKTAESKVNSWLRKDSLYNKIEDSIRARTTASQDNPTPTSLFAKQLADKIIKTNPPKVIRLGRGSRTLYILGRWVPKALTEKILTIKFRLNRM